MIRASLTNFIEIRFVFVRNERNTDGVGRKLEPTRQKQSPVAACTGSVCNVELYVVSRRIAPTYIQYYAPPTIGT